MKLSTTVLWTCMSVAVIVLLGWLIIRATHKPLVASAIGSSYVFTCSENKTIKAVFFNDENPRVELTTNDNQKFSLPQAISASGARYANTDESIVFWNKGNTAILSENGVVTFSSCVTAGNSEQATTTPQTSTGTTGSVTTSPVFGNSSKETYTNSNYGFSITYPNTLNAQSTFGIFHELNQNDWRFGATTAKRGTPVVDIPVVEIENSSTNGEKKYPLFYTARVRVGVSNDIAQCYVTDDGYANQTVTNVTINGVVFKKFIFGDAAMMKYVNGASYRTVHNGKCYVIEQIQNGSIYRDETVVGGYTDTALAAIYAQTTPIVMSFKFK